MDDDEKAVAQLVKAAFAVWRRLSMPRYGTVHMFMASVLAAAMAWLLHP